MYKNIATQTLRKPLFKSGDLSVDVLRFDKIHRDISGNKWFKLRCHIEEARRQGKKGLVTFGGAYSNHLVATAAAAREHHLLSAGIVRGEETKPENESIKQMRAAGMQVLYVSREEYQRKDDIAANFLLANDDFYYIPEGGAGPAGIKGAAEMLEYAENDNYTHIICPVGTGTTMAGLIEASANHQQVLGISALKISDRVVNELTDYINLNTSKSNWTIIYDYHFGGYAKKTSELIQFMNNIFAEEHVPTDFVYTGKMFFAVYDLIRRNYFKPGSKLLLIHTGGLQGNRSLPQGTLVF
jgi:1-aminocyclopropane-1-carboxylate deaminase